MIKNPVIVTYDDMLQQARRRLQYMQKVYPVKVLEGGMTSYSSTRQIAVQKAIVTFLEQHRPVKQPVLF